MTPVTIKGLPDEYGIGRALECLIDGMTAVMLDGRITPQEHALAMHTLSQWVASIRTAVEAEDLRQHLAGLCEVAAEQRHP